MDKKPNYPVLTLAKSLEIIDLLSKESNKRGLGISELSRQLNMGKSTVHRILDTLAYFKYVEKNDETDKYKLSWGLFYVGQVVPEQNQLSQMNYQILEELSHQTGETVNLSVRSGDESVIIYQYDSKTNLRAGHQVGGREPLYATALGKVLIEDLDRNKLTKILGDQDFLAYTPNTIQNMDALIKHIEKVKIQGYAIDDEEHCLGLKCIAMPLKNYTGEIVAAVSVSAPVVRMSDDKLLEIKEALELACKKISTFLGKQ
ncbi:IclR family transcriptional regulator [Fusibacter ferrireducens]|uniref:IclR family transcriptional regulator n=1 Tax=Fusibacter ferrireducens TaxID=2785058 RepID=A0ABR9ZTY3_9FIRM|nr:IclR family transcriptional regulator [Fusibacter ferrireducens]MBF4693940.1 IclR family transcriptional regulator [Fusibacter ferrireducens]